MALKYYLTDWQNDFQKASRCLDHAINNNKKSQNEYTFACFVAMNKTRVTVLRDCLWYKLFAVGTDGK